MNLVCLNREKLTAKWQTIRVMELQPSLWLNCRSLPALKCVWVYNVCVCFYVSLNTTKKHYAVIEWRTMLRSFVYKVHKFPSFLFFFHFITLCAIFFSSFLFLLPQSISNYHIDYKGLFYSSFFYIYNKIFAFFLMLWQRWHFSFHYIPGRYFISYS